MTEEAIQVLGAAELKSYGGEYSRVYLGDEFCERLLPTRREVRVALGFCRKMGKEFTLVTPYLTDAGLARAEKLLDALPRGTEVVVNDWGLLEDVCARELTPVLGRIVIKYRRDPRVTAIEGNVPKGCRMVLHSSALTQERFKKFLRELGIKRIELDNTPFQVNHGNLKDFKATLHIPYVYVTTTRQCLANYFVKGVFGISECSKSCLKHSFTWSSPDFPEKLIQRGNTLFCLNASTLNGRGYDRVVKHVRNPHMVF